MRTDIKNKILDVAQKLFNERGFNEVSLGDIAGELCISKGNLTYHFKKKEEIVEAILSKIPDDPAPEAPTSLEELNSFFLHIQEVVQTYAFYFWHYTQLAQLSPKIHEKQQKIYQCNFQKLSQTFSFLRENHTIRREAYAGEYARVIDNLLLLNVYWLPFCALRQETAPQTSFQQQAWSAVYPMLTQAGKEELQTIVNRRK